MRIRYAIAVIAAVVGLTSMGLGIWGWSSADSIESMLKMSQFFDNPKHGSTTAEEWRSGYINAMALLLSYGVLCVVAAVALFYHRGWGKYLWLGLVIVGGAAAVPDLPHDGIAWIWLAGTFGILAVSWLGLRDSNVRLPAAP
jgi:hypothetical protein